MNHSARTWDIFCTVVDNFGDIGVTWRLARQLVHEHGQVVRLWIDDLDSFARLCPSLDTALAEQQVAGITVRLWPRDGFPDDVDAAEVVIEAFACTLPDAYLAAMQRRRPTPAWYNLEYLSAEDWIDGCHNLASPQPRFGLMKRFFFPGFTAQTGGLLCEAGLFEARDAWQADQAAQAAYWQALGLPPRREGELRVSVFSYETDALAGLVDTWSLSATPVTALVPTGRALTSIAPLFDQALEAGTLVQHGNLTVKVLPFTDQPGYDRLLWSCDANIVRGEDSFVRAQWAARPFVWHIYPQDEGAHLVKLDAFLERYIAGLPAPQAATVRDLNLAFNTGGDASALWPDLAAALPALTQHALDWAKRQRAHGDLAGHLVHNAENWLQ
ncbi:elongation factor P maturation arginine rhamnosyltransferase EarP [Crenobacter sp. SG2303]|uniref:Protein-arginine rhamnosyltransferase n=1 Tax=Crenobacter oryzisoli TaxID=3056844 RepID=A0ABT7XJ11_9NEIS|nr:elongation factor P maturation arginine rhamnosyltransferase EarP [Crenobacter sp. SG2303]MDN0073789.1 elongation factor P maturation arginine rhamnosyltransferase EarP [Crenobacter sp. SG2303]